MLVVDEPGVPLLSPEVWISQRSLAIAISFEETQRRNDDHEKTSVLGSEHGTLPLVPGQLSVSGRGVTKIRLSPLVLAASLIIHPLF